MNPDLRSVLANAEVVLLDFDGPVCDIFANYPAPEVASDLRKVAVDKGCDLPEEVRDERDPLQVWRIIARANPGQVESIGHELARLEVQASLCAQPTPFADVVMNAVVATGRRLGIVSNNSCEAVDAYLDGAGLRRHFSVVVGRNKQNPDLMKPSPFPILKALKQLGARSSSTVLVGDSVSDIKASCAAGVRSIGYANKPGKFDALSQCGADVAIRNMREVGLALQS